MSDNEEGLRGNEFNNYFVKIPHVLDLFSGVVAINEIPLQIPIRHFIICNLSENHLPGTHWIVIVRPSQNSLEIFNSLGQENLDYLMPYLNLKKEFEISFNKIAFQGVTSKLCGFFCIYFVVFRILNFDLSMIHVLEDIFYSTDSIKNDTIVSQFCNNLLTSTNDDFFSFHDF